MPRRRKHEAPAPAVTADERLGQLLRDMEFDAEHEVRQHFAELERQRQRRARLYRRDVMATWDEQKVGRLVAAGNLSAEDVELWAEARQELKRRVFLRSFGQSLAARTGRKVTIIE